LSWVNVQVPWSSASNTAMKDSPLSVSNQRSDSIVYFRRQLWPLSPLRVTYGIGRPFMQTAGQHTLPGRFHVPPIHRRLGAVTVPITVTVAVAGRDGERRLARDHQRRAPFDAILDLRVDRETRHVAVERDIAQVVGQLDLPV